MTGKDDFDQAVGNWLQEDALSSPPAGGLEFLIATTRRQRPRPAWLAGPGSLWLGEEMFGGARGLGAKRPLGLGWSMLLILLTVVMAATGMILVGSNLFRDDRPSPLAYAFNGDIYVADWDAANAVLIADGDPWGGTGSEMCGSFGANGDLWSPDGRLLAFGSERDSCGWTTRITDPRGSIIATLEGGGHAWSPDSARIATFDVESRWIRIYGTDGVQQALLGMPPRSSSVDYIFDTNARWMPDGESILFNQGRDGWQVALDGSERLPLWVGPDSGSVRHHSPDGTQVAYLQDRSLWIAAADGSGRRELAQDVIDPTVRWSPRGDRIAFVGVRDQGGSDRAEDVGVADPATGHIAWLHVPGGADAGLTIQDYSANGDLILYSISESATAGLWSVSLSSGESRQLVPGDAQGEWRPPIDP